MGVYFAPKGVFTVAVYLGLGGELRMDLKTNDHFIITVCHSANTSLQLWDSAEATL